MGGSGWIDGKGLVLFACSALKSRISSLSSLGLIVSINIDIIVITLCNSASFLVDSFVASEVRISSIAFWWFSPRLRFGFLEGGFGSSSSLSAGRLEGIGSLKRYSEVICRLTSWDS